MHKYFGGKMISCRNAKKIVPIGKLYNSNGKTEYVTQPYNAYHIDYQFLEYLQGIPASSEYPSCTSGLMRQLEIQT